MGKELFEEVVFYNIVVLWNGNRGVLSAYFIRIISEEIWEPFMERT
jgi:transposase-like protein